MLPVAKETLCHTATSTSPPYSTKRNMCFWIESFNFSPKDSYFETNNLQRKRENRMLNLGISHSNSLKKGICNSTCYLTTLCENQVYARKSGLVTQHEKPVHVSETYLAFKISTVSRCNKFW